MATLGDILAAARRSAPGFLQFMETADPALADDIRAAAAGSGNSPATFTRSAIADFSRFANEDDWAQLTRIVRDDADPAMAGLAAMIRWRLAVPGCTDHSPRGSRQE